MDINKLKPWNWFKHENDSANQIPVSKNDVSGDHSARSKTLSTSQHSAVNSLLQLHHEMDRLFEDVWRSFGVPGNTKLMKTGSAFDNSLFSQSALGNYRAKLDVSGSENEYEVAIDLPGLSEDDIQIELSGNTLTVKGKKEEKNESKGKQYYRVERSVGEFQRTLSLPEDASSDDITAEMKHGLLVIRIPRVAIPKDDVKRISISS